MGIKNMPPSGGRNFMEKESIITKTYDFLLYLIPQLSRFPRDQKFILGDRIQILTMDILDLFIEAFYSPNQQKLKVLADANMKLEKLRYLIRLSHDLKLINVHRYEVFSEKINELGKMLGG